MNLGKFAVTFRNQPRVITKQIPEVTNSEKIERELEEVQQVFGCQREELTRQSASLSTQRRIQVENIDEHIDNLQFDPDQDGCESIKSQSSCQDEPDPFGTPVPNYKSGLDRMIEDIELEMKSEEAREPDDFLSDDLRQMQKLRPCLIPHSFSEQASPERDVFLRMSAPLPKPLSDGKEPVPIQKCCLSDPKGLEQEVSLGDFEFLPPADVTLCRHNSQTCQALSRDHSRSRLLSEPLGASQPEKPQPELLSQPSCEGDPSITSSTTGSANHQLGVGAGVAKPECSKASHEAQQSPSCF